MAISSTFSPFMFYETRRARYVIIWMSKMSPDTIVSKCKRAPLVLALNLKWIWTFWCLRSLIWESYWAAVKMWWGLLISQNGRASLLFCIVNKRFRDVLSLSLSWYMYESPLFVERKSNIIFKQKRFSSYFLVFRGRRQGWGGSAIYNVLCLKK